MAEMKSCWDAEKHRLVSELQNQTKVEKEKAILDTKSKQWVRNQTNTNIVNVTLSNHMHHIGQCYKH